MSPRGQSPPAIAGGAKGAPPAPQGDASVPLSAPLVGGNDDGRAGGTDSTAPGARGDPSAVWVTYVSSRHRISRRFRRAYRGFGEGARAPAPFPSDQSRPTRTSDGRSLGHVRGQPPVPMHRRLRQLSPGARHRDRA